MKPEVARVPNVIDLSKVLGKAKNRIYRVGIELEGGWRRLPKGVNALEHDGSVKIKPPEEVMRLPAGHPDRGFQAGEIPSPELELSPTSNIYWVNWMKKHYPSDVNDTCGLHVHLSFSNALHYQRLMEPWYQDTILAYLKLWGEEVGFEKSHCIWERLKGTNQYCQALFFPDFQVTAKSKNYNRDFPGHRYTVVNYCHGLHGTLECRVLPMMKTCEQGISAVQRVIDITNACLAKYHGREGKVKVEIGGDFGDLVEVEEFHPPVGVMARSRR